MKNEEIKELLLKDLQNLSDSLWKNEEAGERRVTFLTTLVGAVMAALGRFITKTDGSIALPATANLTIGIAVFSLFALFVFGLLTLLRIIKRNRTTDGYKRDMEEIRERIKELYDPFGTLVLYQPYRGSSPASPTVRRLGGLADTVSAINALVLAGLSLLLVNYLLPHPGTSVSTTALCLIITVPLFVFFVGFVVQHRLVRFWDRSAKDAFLTHAGGVVFRPRPEGGHDFLLITAKNRADQWVLPKGHIEKGEKAEQAAVREVEEEAGVKAKIVKDIATVTFMRGSECVRARFYLMEASMESGALAASPTEDRTIAWFSPKEARDRVTFQNAREILKEAEGTLRLKAKATP